MWRLIGIFKAGVCTVSQNNPETEQISSICTKTFLLCLHSFLFIYVILLVPYRFVCLKFILQYHYCPEYCHQTHVKCTRKDAP